jgi:8-oxo-dGTP pyrophosphatase MutT (NUDIX family)
VEPGETQEQTLERELGEELGITPVQWRFMETMTLDVPQNVQAEERSDLLIVHLYIVTAWTGTPTNRQPQEHSTTGWFSLAEAVQLPLADPIYPELFARYLNSS